MEREVPIGPDGIVEVTIDPAELGGSYVDRDRQYTIQATVTDHSRREVEGIGRVTMSRDLFRVHAWSDRGFYHAGDEIHAQFAARMLDGSPVEGRGTLRLLGVTYDARGAPIESPLREWRLDTDAKGLARQAILPPAAGQYRLAYEVTDASGRTVEGGHLVTVRDAGFDGSRCRFDNLELIAERPEYSAGDSARLMVNAN